MSDDHAGDASCDNLAGDAICADRHRLACELTLKDAALRARDDEIEFLRWQLQILGAECSAWYRWHQESEKPPLAVEKFAGGEAISSHWTSRIEELTVNHVRLEHAFVEREGQVTEQLTALKDCVGTAMQDVTSLFTAQLAGLSGTLTASTGAPISDLTNKVEALTDRCRCLAQDVKRVQPRLMILTLERLLSERGLMTSAE